jgi:hypothetical protein
VILVCFIGPLEVVDEDSAEAASIVGLAVYELPGREVAVRVNERMEAGVHSVTFDASGLSSCFYICRMAAGPFAATKKLVLVH